MPDEAVTERMMIGHVLFIDIVGYSKLLLNEQRSALTDLTRLVQSTDQFRRADESGNLIRLPTGDGMALVFSDSPESPAESAVEISRAYRARGEVCPVRMGIHSGPVNQLVDVTQRTNLAGAGINLAQRVMDCGDAGHILVSKHVAEDLEHDERWRPNLHDLGECEVKHGVRVSLTSLYGPDFGRAEMPAKVKEFCKANELRRRKRQRLWTFGIIAALVTTAVSPLLVRKYLDRRISNEFGAVPLKSIAVMPFANFSADQQNLYFADGIHDELLTYLAKIADLKVISRTSVMQYQPGTVRNARAIGRELGVANLLEGSVQRFGNKVRVNAQLIDARLDTHVWAQSYDRDLSDVFAIESEIAKAIADQLKAKLSTAEQSELDKAPTSNEQAFALYSEARTLLINATTSSPDKETFLHVASLLDQAVAHDADFFMAYCQLVHTHAEIYFYNLDHSDQRRSLAEAALNNAIRLRPDAGETHLAQAEYLYRCYLKNDRALAELALAARALPNNSRVYELSGYIERRQGRWEEARRDLEKALQLDPRNVVILQQIANIYPYLRRFDEEAAVLERFLKLVPKDDGARVSRAFVEVERRANLEPYREAVRSILDRNPESKEDIASEWFAVAWYGRDPSQAKQAAAAIPSAGAGSNAVRFPKAWYEGLAARLDKNSAKANQAFSIARAAVEHQVQERPEYGPPLCVLGMIDAILGNKENAIREGRRSVELLPIDQDAINGSQLIMNLAVIYAATGEKEAATNELQTLFSKPGDGSYGDLKLNPFWDPLRGDPSFEKLVASQAPKN